MKIYTMSISINKIYHTFFGIVYIIFGFFTILFLEKMVELKQFFLNIEIALLLWYNKRISIELSDIELDFIQGGYNYDNKKSFR